MKHRKNYETRERQGRVWGWPIHLLHRTGLPECQETSCFHQQGLFIMRAASVSAAPAGLPALAWQHNVTKESLILRWSGSPGCEDDCCGILQQHPDRPLQANQLIEGKLPLLDPLRRLRRPSLHDPLVNRTKIGRHHRCRRWRRGCRRLLLVLACISHPTAVRDPKKLGTAGLSIKYRGCKLHHSAWGHRDLAKSAEPG